MRILLFTNFIPAYRFDFFDKLANNAHLSIICASSTGNSSLQSLQYSSRSNFQAHHCREVKIFGCIFHVIPVSRIISLIRRSDILVFDGNLRHISYVFVSIVCILLKRKCVIWSCDNHKSSSSLFSSLMISIRHFYWSFFDGYFMYGLRDAHTLRHSYLSSFFDRIFVIGNGLAKPPIVTQTEIDSYSMSVPFDMSKPYILSVGRFYDERFIDIQHIVSKWLLDNPMYSWVVIGDGDQKEIFEASVRTCNLTSRIHCLGSVVNEIHLSAIFSHSLFILHSGTVGLHVLDAYRFSKRILIPSDPSLYSIEADMCVEPVRYRYTSTNLYTLLDHYVSTDIDISKFNEISKSNNTSTMATNFLVACTSMMKSANA